MRVPLIPTKQYAATKRKEMGNVCLAGLEERKNPCMEVLDRGDYDDSFNGDKHEHMEKVLINRNSSNSHISHPTCDCEEMISEEKKPRGGESEDSKQSIPTPEQRTHSRSMSEGRNHSFRVSPRFIRKALHRRLSDGAVTSIEASINNNSSVQCASFRRKRPGQHRKTLSSGANNSPLDNDSTRPTSDHNALKSMRQGSAKLTHNLGQAVGHFLRSIEEFFFPRMTLDTATSKHPLVFERPRVPGGVLLRDCQTMEEHHAKVQEYVKAIRRLHGQEGLRAVGLEYRLLPCEAHAPVLEETSCGESRDSGSSCDDGHEEAYQLPTLPTSLPKRLVTGQSRDVTDSMKSDVSVESVVDVAVSIPSPDDINEADFVAATEADFASGLARRCHLCMRRLYHIDSDTLVTEGIRKSFIADGDMYEEVARLCQEFVHDIMCQEGNMQWVTIETQGDHSKEPIRAIINKDHPLIAGRENSAMASRPSLLIVTGRGKVRAGIFSRQHLICSGLESATAVPIVWEALRRRLNIIIADPNCHGEAQGFVVFEKTMDFLSSLLSSSQHSTSSDAPLQARDLYVLSHSASGGHLARYLLDKSELFLPHIQAIAFTDSTHNIQWCKTRNNHQLHDMLESPKCVYFRSSKVRVEDQSQWYLHRAGEEIATDSFWQHRFGKIRTFWAGTNEHSLTNWFAHGEIWKHFDRHLNPATTLAAHTSTGTSNGQDATPVGADARPHHHFNLREPGSTLVL